MVSLHKPLYKPCNKTELEALVMNPDVSLGEIDTSLITDMSSLFVYSQRKDFSGIENWNTSRVTDMSSMFSDAKEFNQPIKICLMNQGIIVSSSSV